MASKPAGIPNPHLPPSRRHADVTGYLSQGGRFAAGSTEGLCSFGQWGQCEVAFVYFIPCLHFFQQTFFPLPSLPSLLLHRLPRTYSCLPCWHMSTMRCACSWLLTSLQKSATRRAETFRIVWLKWFIPYPPHCPCYSHSLQRGLVPSKCLLGPSMT